MLIVFIGPPGVGKGTQAKRLAAHLQIVHLSTGELLRDAERSDSNLGREAAGYLHQGRLVPDPLVLSLVRGKLAEPALQAGCVFDGFPRTISQARSLDELLLQRMTPLDVALEFKAEEEVLIDRMLKRAAQESRPDDNPQTIAHRMEVFHQQTTPLRDYYRSQGKLVNIHALGTPDEVFHRVLQAVNARRTVQS